MSIRTARFRRAVLALLTVAPLVFVGQATVGAGTAEARCAGIGNPVAGSLVINGYTYITETPASNTCDGNRNYITTLQVLISSGWRASIVYSDARGNVCWCGWYTGYNSTPVTVGEGASVCCYTRITLCLDDGLGNWYCGYGSNYVYDTTWRATYYGDHTGY